MSFICQIHNYTEYNEEFNPSKWSSGQPLRRPGSSWGFALLKGLTSVVDTSCQSRDSNMTWQLNAKCTFIWKEDFGPLSNSPVLFSLAHVRCFWRCFCFRSGLVALFLKMSELQFQFTHCEALPSVLIGFAWQYSQASGHPCCLYTFSYPIYSFQSTLHLICFDTALREQPPLSVMTLFDLPSLWRVSKIVFWTIAKSAVFPIIVVSKNKRYPVCVQPYNGWSFIETQI